jgi:hypothetical protein
MIAEATIPDSIKAATGSDPTAVALSRKHQAEIFSRQRGIEWQGELIGQL